MMQEKGNELSAANAELERKLRVLEQEVPNQHLQKMSINLFEIECSIKVRQAGTSNTK